MKVCCVTGNRPQKFPWKHGEGIEHEKYLADMARQIEELIKNGYNYFISGGALGVDQDFAEAILQIKQIYAETQLEIAVPYKNQADRWSETDQLHYFSILERADKVVIVSKHYTRFCMQKRNEYMVNKSDLVLTYWNGDESGGTWNTISYAQRAKKSVVIIELIKH